MRSTTSTNPIQPMSFEINAEYETPEVPSPPPERSSNGAFLIKEWEYGKMRVFISGLNLDPRPVSFVRVSTENVEGLIDGTTIRSILKDSDVSEDEWSAIEAEVMELIAKEGDKRGLTLTAEYRRALANLMVLVAKQVGEEVS